MEPKWVTFLFVCNPGFSFREPTLVGRRQRPSEGVLVGFAIPHIRLLQGCWPFLPLGDLFCHQLAENWWSCFHNGIFSTEREEARYPAISAWVLVFWQNLPTFFNKLRIQEIRTPRFLSRDFSPYARTDVPLLSFVPLLSYLVVCVSFLRYLRRIIHV